MMAGAALCWAATTLVIKSSALARVSPEKTLLYQLVVCVPIVALGALVFGERIAAMPSAVALGSLAYQTIVVGTTFSLWFALIVQVLGKPPVGLHIPDAAVRRCGRPSGAGRAADAGFCAAPWLLVAARADTRQPAPVGLYDGLAHVERVP